MAKGHDDATGVRTPIRVALLEDPSEGSAPTARRTWTDKRIAAELQTFLAGRHDWPRRAQFDAAGRRDLIVAIYRAGGPKRWAPLFGCSVRSRGRELAWTDERIRRELIEFMTDRAAWPGASGFEDMGRRDLYEAIARRGGVRYWIAQIEDMPSPTS